MQEVYDLIMNDLNNAVRYLKGAKRIDKGYIDQSVAYGLRARVNLVMNNWEAAARAVSYTHLDVYKRQNRFRPVWVTMNCR